MAKKKKAFDKLQWIAAYKSFVLEKGELPATVRELAEMAGQTFPDFKKQFTDLRQLETAVIALYFKEANDLLMADEKFEEYSNKEKQLAFLYVMIEKAGADEVFLQEFQRLKKTDRGFAVRLMRFLNRQELSWAELSWGASTAERVGINPKQAALIQHALSTLMFFLKDYSEEKQATDAYIEKTTDVLYRLTDTSTVRSMVDLGKFLFSRRKTTFSWE
ncbi:MAG: hypothetical protein ACFB10_14985 [Salibacteraceae bacterium]